MNHLCVRLTGWLLLPALALASACGQDRNQPLVPTTPGLMTRTPPTPSFSGRAIRVGERIEDALTDHGTERVYDLTVPSDGVLTVRLSWNMEDGILELWLEDKPIARSSPAVATLRVSAGRTYRLWVVDPFRWTYGEMFVPFVLTTTLEP